MIACKLDVDLDILEDFLGKTLLGLRGVAKTGEQAD